MTTIPSTRVQSPFATPAATVREPARPEPMAVAARPQRRAPVELPLRPLTGWEEEFVDRDKADPNTARLCNEVLARCLGPPKGEPDAQARALVRGLLVAERDRALVQLRRISLGPQITTEVRCACGTANEVAFALDALDLAFSLPVGPLRCELGEGKVAEVALPTAGDQEDLFDAAVTTAAERKTWLLGRLLRRYGERTEGLDQDFARGLPIAERRRLETAIDEALPDFDLSMLVRCCACNSEMRVPFDVPVFFLAS